MQVPSRSNKCKDIAKRHNHELKLCASREWQLQQYAFHPLPTSSIPIGFLNHNAGLSFLLRSSLDFQASLFSLRSSFTCPFMLMNEKHTPFAWGRTGEHILRNYTHGENKIRIKCSCPSVQRQVPPQLLRISRIERLSCRVASTPP